MYLPILRTQVRVLGQSDNGGIVCLCTTGSLPPYVRVYDHNLVLVADQYDGIVACALRSRAHRISGITIDDPLPRLGYITVRVEVGTLEPIRFQCDLIGYGPPFASSMMPYTVECFVKCGLREDETEMCVLPKYIRDFVKWLLTQAQRSSLIRIMKWLEYMSLPSDLSHTIVMAICELMLRCDYRKYCARAEHGLFSPTCAPTKVELALP